MCIIFSYFPTKKGVCNEKIVINILLAFEKCSSLRLYITPSGCNKYELFCMRMSYMDLLSNIKPFPYHKFEELHVFHHYAFDMFLRNRILCVQVYFINITKSIQLIFVRYFFLS